MNPLIEALEKLLIDPEVSTSPKHCIDEYNAGVLNATIVVKEVFSGEE